MENLHLARIKKFGNTFELVIDADKAAAYKEGKIPNVREALNAENVFTDAKKGEKASESAMKEAFGTSNVLEVAEIIIKKGELQLTSEHREKAREEKRKQIVNKIHMFAVDPKTGIPHPITRLENAMEEAKVRIDDRNVDEQVQEIIKALRPILPIRMEVKEIQVHLSASYAAKLFGMLQKFKMIKEEWQNDGSWLGTLEVPAGLEPDLYEKLNNETHGDVEIKVIGVKE